MRTARLGGVFSPQAGPFFFVKSNDVIANDRIPLIIIDSVFTCAG